MNTFLIVIAVAITAVAGYIGYLGVSCYLRQREYLRIINRLNAADAVIRMRR